MWVFVLAAAAAIFTVSWAIRRSLPGGYPTTVASHCFDPVNV
jgi:hypothetical protein